MLRYGRDTRSAGAHLVRRRRPRTGAGRVDGADPEAVGATLQHHRPRAGRAAKPDRGDGRATGPDAGALRRDLVADGTGDGPPPSGRRGAATGPAGERTLQLRSGGARPRAVTRERPGAPAAVGGVSRLPAGTGNVKPSTARRPRTWFCAWQSSTQSVGGFATSTASSPVTKPIRPPLATSQSDWLPQCSTLGDTGVAVLHLGLVDALGDLGAVARDEGGGDVVGDVGAGTHLHAELAGRAGGDVGAGVPEELADPLTEVRVVEVERGHPRLGRLRQRVHDAGRGRPARAPSGRFPPGHSPWPGSSSTRRTRCG